MRARERQQRYVCARCAARRDMPDHFTMPDVAARLPYFEAQKHAAIARCRHDFHGDACAAHFLARYRDIGFDIAFTA